MSIDMGSIFILGAGFSKPANLPLGDEIFPEIISRAKSTFINGNNLYNNILKQDIDRFLRYFNKINEKPIGEEKINFEEFISFLDIEHYLRGNFGTIRTAISEISRTVIPVITRTAIPVFIRTLLGYFSE